MKTFITLNLILAGFVTDIVKIMGKHKHNDFISEGSTEAIFMMFGLF